MSSKQIRRITLFKIPTEEGQNALLEKYRTMPVDAKKDGKPYILSVSANKAVADQRAQGYTVVVVSMFANKEDMVYYDEGCEAHKALKGVAKQYMEGVMMVYGEVDV